MAGASGAPFEIQETTADENMPVDSYRLLVPRCVIGVNDAFLALNTVYRRHVFIV
jgi:hypothetical protein